MSGKDVKRQVMEDLDDNAAALLAPCVVLSPYERDQMLGALLGSAILYPAARALLSPDEAGDETGGPC